MAEVIGWLWVPAKETLLQGLCVINTLSHIQQSSLLQKYTEPKLLTSAWLLNIQVCLPGTRIGRRGRAPRSLRALWDIRGDLVVSKLYSSGTHWWLVTCLTGVPLIGFCGQLSLENAII